jgi:hypothetical protein
MSDRQTPNDANPRAPAAASFEDLVALIDEELRVQIAVGRLGDINPEQQAIHKTATLIADVVFRAYRFAPKRRST